MHIVIARRRQPSISIKLVSKIIISLSAKPVLPFALVIFSRTIRGVKTCPGGEAVRVNLH